MRTRIQLEAPAQPAIRPSAPRVSPQSETGRGRAIAPALTAGAGKINGGAQKGVGPMWRSISLRNRINLIFASLFALWLVADAVHDVWRASGRARAETESAMRLTKEFVSTTLALSPEAPEPEAIEEARRQPAAPAPRARGRRRCVACFLASWARRTGSRGAVVVSRSCQSACRNSRHSGCDEEWRDGVDHHRRRSRRTRSTRSGRKRGRTPSRADCWRSRRSA